MTFKHYFIAFLVLASVGMASAAVHHLASSLAANAPKTGSSFEPGLTALTRSATVSVGTASTGVASTSSSRRYLQIQNTSSGVTAFCAYSGTSAAVGTQGFFIAASSTFSLPVGDGPMYTGSINCIASSTIALLINEG